MRILLLTTHLNIGGISTYTVGLARALKAKGHEVFVASNGGVLVPELALGGISHIKVDILTKSELNPMLFRAVLEISGMVKKLNIDIIHAQTRVSQVVGFFVSKMRKVTLVTTCHGFFNMNLGRMLMPSWGDKVIAISDAVERHLMEDFKVKKDRISLIYNGIEIKKFLRDFSEDEKLALKDKFGLRRDCGVIGTIARFTPDKGHDVLLYALREILKQKPDVQLVFAGDGKERQNIVDKVSELGLGENVVFVKSQIDTVNILSAMDVFMFAPARREGLGIALLEAMASGKPVVATKVGGISSIINDGVNGFLVEPSRPELLVGPVLALLKDRGLYERMSRAGLETVVNKFSIEGMAERTEEAYREVIGIR